ncbi:30S ribosomal protein S20 [Thiorhodospira sibirica]|uniref:30S ribosomal protein S20 n=1 Tax=Thiorhodospira sibirica TaxID=154347 RepID=UPI00022C1723|nr:30S ribosomal protein S20 [Thiorhodospira sibirica]
MANIKSARKRARQAEVSRQRNVALRSRFRTAVKKVIKALRDGDKQAAQSAYQAAVPIIDGAVNKGIIHRNKAARHKSRLNTRIKAAS